MARPRLAALVAALLALPRVASAEEPAAPSAPAQATVVIAPSPSSNASARPGVRPAPKPLASAVSASKTAAASATKSVATPSSRAKPKDAKPKPKKRDELPAGMTWHTVRTGQKLGSIAKRYRVSVPALCAANDIARRDKLKPGLRLIVPSPKDEDGSLARAVRVKLLGLPLDPADGPRDESTREPTLSKVASDRDVAPDARRSPHPLSKDASWLPFVARPKKKGVVHLKSREHEWAGQLLRRSGRVLPKARRELERLFAMDDGVGLDVDLFRHLVRLSDTFGGRTIRVVSGYRTAGTVERSRHKEGKALDFTVDGVTLEALYDYCRSLDGVGVGYYPTSGFVHLDVRDRWTSWVDESGRGEPPRPVSESPARAKDREANPSPDAASAGATPTPSATTSASPEDDSPYPDDAPPAAAAAPLEPSASPPRP